MNITNDRLRVGVVGADIHKRGFGARAHLPAVLASPAVQLDAICTAHPETAKESAAIWGAPKYYSDHRDLVGDPDIDLITIAVTVEAHYPIAKAAMEAGKTVYCEWPLASNLDEARDLADLAHAQGAVAMVGMQGRFSPGVQYLKELLDDGLVGRPLFFHLTHFLPRFPVRSDHWWSATKEAGSGALNIALAHATEPTQFLLGQIAAVCGMAGTLLPGDYFSDTGEPFDWTAEDTVAVMARTEEGVQGVIHVSNIGTQRSGFRLQIFGDQGQVLIQAPRYVSYTPTRLFKAVRGEAELLEIPVPAHFYHVPELSENETGYNIAEALVTLASAHRSQTSVRPDLSDGYHMHLLVDAIRRSVDQGAWVDV
ncbi:MAG: Gfo/Idh/MocA family oxidoreductase [Chloroflexi bacterium]|nr:Gfo/Idh/MocA family oxidoreductase [Chloroflexota bacterium]